MYSIDMDSDSSGKLPQSSQNIENDSGNKFTIPGILHFIQHEWARFEMERAHWEVERAELQARIAFLQGERKGQENLKHDLIRRIKMLEFALKQERAKYHRLKYGTDLGQERSPPKEQEQKEEHPNEVTGSSNKPSMNWRQGRQLLRQYLQEVGYTDAILDVRSSRVRSILGLSAAEPLAPAQMNGTSPRKPDDGPEFIREPSPQSREPVSVRQQAPSSHDVVAPNPIRRAPPHIPPIGKKPADEDFESEAAVMANFDFLENDIEDEEENEDEVDDGGSADDEDDERDVLKTERRIIKKPKTDSNEDLSPEEEEALDEFKFVMGDDDDMDSDSTVIEVPTGKDLDDVNIHMPDGEEGMAEQDHLHPDGTPKDEWDVDPSMLAKLKEQYKKERKSKKNVKRPPRSALQVMIANLGGDEEMPPQSQSTPAPATTGPSPVRLVGSRAMSEIPPPIGSVKIPTKTEAAPAASSPPKNEPFEDALGLGELAELTVNNEAEALSYEINKKDEFRKTWNPKFTLRSHFDSIRSVYFHPQEAAVITASEDHTMKLWNLQKTVPQKKSNILDVEPIYTFRGHSAAVLSVVISSTSDMCFSGGADGTILCWNIPSLDLDPYGPYSPNVTGALLEVHTDAVWGLAVQTNSLQLLSCSSDGTCRLWNPTLKSPLLNTFILDKESSCTPTSIDFLRMDTSQMVASYSSARAAIFDLETAEAVVNLDSAKTYNNSPSTQINKVVSHPTLPVTITAHEDRHIRFFDNNTGKQIHSMVAHLDAVTSLAVDPNGLYLLSGSHDCSIRLWNLDSKTCVQEITSHRKKFDESIYDVAFHPTKPYIASAGADGLAKVFV
ncbi:striatin [Nematostella vectensis]|uniref:striatin n=1 Tax=Nematostella vectensis TaxID=45351 RepID=UPI002076F406|nr:striatin [Nematostella vectensis]